VTQSDHGPQRPPTERQLWLLPGDAPTAHQPVAEVAVAQRVYRLHTYGIAPDLRGRVTAGAIVRVPFGKRGRLTEGVCVRVTERPWDHTRPPVADVLPVPPVLDGPLLELGQWIAEYYFCPPGVVFDAMVPLRARQVRWRRVRCLRRAGDPPAGRRLTPRQQAVLDALADGPRPRAEVLAATGTSPATVTRLCKLGWVAVFEQRVVADADAPTQMGESGPSPDAAGPTHMGGSGVSPDIGAPEDALTLTPGQQAALDAITATALPQPAFRTFLLFGVPGSGKTEVYVRAARAVIAAGRQAILVVPEIALATQVVERLARRFARVAVLHSHLPERLRLDTLRRIAAGAVDVVIGTRTAVFAPCRRLGLIVVDEEQEGSLKNLAAPFFHARDVAIKRGQLQGLPVVLGSATPALETWYNATHRPHYTCLKLPERVPGAQLPDVRLVPTQRDDAPAPDVLLSSLLLDELRATLAAGRQAILLHNRRGYAVALRCVRCGTTVRCPRCDAALVLHQADARGAPPTGAAPRSATLRCHQCGQSSPLPPHCPDSSCAGKLEPGGLAIQRLEEALRRRLPTARLLRLDRDTMRRRADYEQALRQFEAGGADILLGTQMVAKGLDFPGVRLVGVIDADAALWLPDFRAGERVFQLLMQVVGRAGRRDGASLAVVQSGNVTAPAIREAIRHNYPGFAETELASRHRFYYPPFCGLVRMVLADPRPRVAREAAEALTAALAELAPRVHPELRISGGQPCTIARLRELHRYQVLLRGPRDGSLQKLLHAALAAKLLRPRVQRFTIDVDALDLL
jgi:primosomal protein N' (replication factor Y)